MGRKRKIPIADEEKENTVSTNRKRDGGGIGTSASNSMMLHGPIYTIMSNVQLNETNHKKYIKELKQLYAKMDHDAFMYTLIKMIKAAMGTDEGNDYAETTLIFCSKFVSSYDGDDTHPVLIDMCKWLLTSISRNPHIRYRICQFVNMILKALGQEAALDDSICDRIMEYMLHRLHDTSTNVRVQAILAMQRLQVPDNPDDPVLRAYQFHLCSDPSSRVRQAVITCMGRNYHTIPYILERLWDIDEKVRRHTYLHMSSYPVRSYKVSQRLTLLQQGLNDRSDSVRKVVVTIMLQQWIESYQKDLIALISALKLDSSETEIDRFRKVAKQTLKEIFKFKLQNKQDLLACVPLEEEGEIHRCVPYEKLTMEIALYWQCLTEFLQSEMAEEFDLIVPELSTFCTYVEKFCQQQKPDLDKFDIMEFQYKLLSLMEILYTYDLGDEIGRGNLQKLLAYLLKTFRLDEKVIEVIVRCSENLITDQNARIQVFVEIIQDISDLNGKPNDLLHDRTLISELMASSSNPDLNLKLSSLKVKILDLEEQEMNYVQRKDYMRAQQITEEKHATMEEYTNLLQPLLDKHPNAQMLKAPLKLRKPLKPENILKSLQIAFHMVVSPKVRSLNPSFLKLYNDFFCRHLASNQIAIRDWALKCGTACSMLYEVLAKDVFEELYSQFFKNHNIRIWETSITCIFELLDRYGLDNFAKQEEQNKTKKSGRQLYNTLEFLDSEDDSNVLNAGQGVDVIYMMSHFLDTCDDTCIVSAIIFGFCRLILRGYITSSDIIEKLLLRYFNPSTDSNINQILGVFLENLIQRKRHGLLQPCLLPMISTVLSAPYENPLHDIRPETIARFIIDSTRQERSTITDGNIHNKIAQTFLQEMLNNLANKELCKLLAKELITLELNVAHIPELQRDMKESADKLIQADLDPKTVKQIIDFKDLVDGNYNPTRKIVRNESGGEEDSNDETENEAKDDDDNATITTVRSKTSVSEIAEEPLNQLQAQARQPPLNETINVPEQTPSPVNAAVICASVEEDPATGSNDVLPLDSEALNSTGMTATDSSIITKDISPPTSVPTTYGRENRVGHRYLRKSLNSTRGQSDTETGDGPQRSPKIRIEARIDSDKKKEQPRREDREVRDTRVRRNLRYGLRNNEGDGVVKSSKEVTTNTKTRANHRSKSASISPSKRHASEATKEHLNEDEEPRTKAKGPNRIEQSNDQQSTNQSTEQLADQSKKHTIDKSTEQSENQPSEQPMRQPQEQSKELSKERSKENLKKAKEQSKKHLRSQITTRAKELHLAKVTPITSNKHSKRSLTRSAGKPFNADELNTSDVIPPSPPVTMSPRALGRRRRRAGGGDISVANLTASHRRATRSQSASNRDPNSTSESEREDHRTTNKPLSPPRTNLKRVHNSTPKLVTKESDELNSDSLQSRSPHQKRMRTGSSSKQHSTRSFSTPPPQKNPTDNDNSLSLSEKRKRGRPRNRFTNFVGREEKSNEKNRRSPEKRKRGRPRNRFTHLVGREEMGSEKNRRSAESNINESRVLKTAINITEQTTTSATRSRSLIHRESPTRTPSRTRTTSITSTRSTSRTSSLTRTCSNTRAVSSIRTSSTTRIVSPTKARSTTRTISVTRTRSSERSLSISRVRSAKRISSLTRTRFSTRATSLTRTRLSTKNSSSTKNLSKTRATSLPRRRLALRGHSPIRNRTALNTSTPLQSRDSRRDASDTSNRPTKPIQTLARNTNSVISHSDKNIKSSTPRDESLGNVNNQKSTILDERQASNEKLVAVSTSPSTKIATRRGLALTSDADNLKSIAGNITSESMKQRALRSNISKTAVATNDVRTSKKSSFLLRPSKIPVRASNSKLTVVMKPRHVTLNVSKTSLALAPKAIESNSSSGSGSSSNDETVKTLGAAMLRKHALTTKMTRINLPQRSIGNPMPMALARPKRVLSNNLASSTNLKATKKR